MRLRPYGDRALILDLEDAGEVVSWVSAIREAHVPGVTDVVPAARTVLVVAADGTEVGALAAALQQVRVDRGRGDAEPGTHEVRDQAIVIPVVYEGPDLADVGEMTGLGADGVVAVHTATSWRVAFGGFAPGFAYLVGGDPRLHVPRRHTARTSVPSGAVGLAGEYSGIYPRPSPGGWQLIGTTDAVLWDLDRDPPALLRPGATVRFEAVRA